MGREFEALKNVYNQAHALGVVRERGTPDQAEAMMEELRAACERYRKIRGERYVEDE